MTVGDAAASATFSDAITSCGAYARHMEPCPPRLVLPHLFSEPFRLHLVTTKPFRQLGFSRGGNAGTGHTPASLLESKRLVTATAQERQRVKRQCILPLQIELVASVHRRGLRGRAQSMLGCPRTGEPPACTLRQSKQSSTSHRIYNSNAHPTREVLRDYPI